MLPNPSPTEADRIALNKMFKAIAEYGRKVRLRKQTDKGLVIQEIPEESAPELARQTVQRRRQFRKKKV
jgi:hypothetical protein